MNSGSHRDPLEELADEFVSRYRLGERPAVSEYAKRYPELADEVRAVFPALVMMEDLASSSDGSSSAPIALQDGEDEEAPEQLGDFRIVREIGRGGMGIVYEAEQMCLQRRVAVKVLPTASLRSRSSRARFLREAQSAARLHHTNIVPVFGVGEEHGLQYYAMQYIEGRGLDQVVREMSGETERNGLWVKRASLISGITGGSAVAGSAADASEGESETAVGDTETGHLADTAIAPRPGMPAGAETTTIREGKPAQARYWESVARIGVQVSDALEHSHAHGILHRDIKPGNLLLDGQGTVWVTDFGLARTDDDDENVTATGEVVGTLRYSAPEQIEGNVDARSDVYSLGLTMYELLAMQPAFTERSRRRLADQVVRGEIRPLRKIDPEIPRDLETIVHKAIRRDPEARYQSAGEFTADLRRFLNGEPIHARRVTLTERVWRWCRRNPVVTWSVVGSVAAILVTLSAAVAIISRDRSNLEQLASENGRLLEEELRNNQQLREANRLEQEATRLAKRRAIEKSAVFDFLVLDMFKAGLPARARGKDLTLRAMLEQAANRVGARFDDQPAEEAAVRTAIGTVYYRMGEFDKARVQWKTAWDLRRRHFGEQDLATLSSMRNLANALHKQGHYQEGIQLQVSALATLRKLYGSEHPETLRMLSDLGATLHSQGKYPEALARLQAAFEGKKKTQGESHRDTLVTMSNIAVTLQKMERYREAERINRRALDLMQQTYGKDHPRVLGRLSLVTLGNLALNLSKQERHAEAEALNRRLLLTRRRLLGNDHPETLTAINNLAANLVALKKPVDAQRLYQEIYTRSKTSAGPYHPQTLMAANNLAWTVHEKGESLEARRIFTQLLGIARRELGADHPVVATIESNLAKLPVVGGIAGKKQGGAKAARSLKKVPAKTNK